MAESYRHQRAGVNPVEELGSGAFRRQGNACGDYAPGPMRSVPPRGSGWVLPTFTHDNEASPFLPVKYIINGFLNTSLVPYPRARPTRYRVVVLTSWTLWMSDGRAWEPCSFVGLKTRGAC